MDEARLVPALLWTYDVHPRLTINHLNTKQIFNISSIYQEINMRRSWCSPTTGRNLMGATLDPRTTENRWWLPWTPWWELPWTWQRWLTGFWTPPFTENGSMWTGFYNKKQNTPANQDLFFTSWGRVTYKNTLCNWLKTEIKIQYTKLYSEK